MAKDPVCGMEVDEATARHTAQYQGQTYYFCAPGVQEGLRGRPAPVPQAPGTPPRWLATPSEPPTTRGTRSLRSVVTHREAFLTA